MKTGIFGSNRNSLSHFKVQLEQLKRCCTDCPIFLLPFFISFMYSCIYLVHSVLAPDFDNGPLNSLCHQSFFRQTTNNHGGVVFRTSDLHPKHKSASR